MTNVLPRLPVVGATIAAVLLLSSFCCCMGGAISPSMTPHPPSKDLAQDMRDRVMQIKSKQGPFTLDVTDKELASYIVGLLQSGAGEFPARDMQIEFGDGYADIWATFIDIAPTDVPVYIRATAEAKDGQMVFGIVKAHAGQFPVPGAMRESIAQSLGESLTELQLGLQIDSVQIQPGVMTLSGEVTGTIPDLP